MHTDTHLLPQRLLSPGEQETLEFLDEQETSVNQFLPNLYIRDEWVEKPVNQQLKMLSKDITINQFACASAGPRHEMQPHFCLSSTAEDEVEV